MDSPTPSHRNPGGIPNRFGGGAGPAYFGRCGPFFLRFYRGLSIEGQKALLSASRHDQPKRQGICTYRQERRCWVFSSDFVSQLVIHIPVICRSVPVPAKQISSRNPGTSSKS